MNGHGETPREAFAVHAYRSVAWVSRKLPYEWGRRAADVSGRALHALLPGVRATVARNLSGVLGSPPESAVVAAATREAFRSYALYWYETFHLPVMTPGEFLPRFRMVGEEHIKAAVDAGTGAVLALPHLGNWDAAARWVTRRGYRITAVAERLKPERMTELFVEHRRSLGMGIVTLAEDRRVGEELVRLISQNELICLVADRDLTGRGVEVEMFGERTYVPAGPALLSLATGAPLLPAAVYHGERGGWTCVIAPPITIERSDSFRADVTELTRRLAHEFERAIASAPTDWHVFQDYWAAANRRGETHAAPVPGAAGGAVAAPAGA